MEEKMITCKSTFVKVWFSLKASAMAVHPVAAILLLPKNSSFNVEFLIKNINVSTVELSIMK